MSRQFVRALWLIGFAHRRRDFGPRISGRGFLGWGRGLSWWDRLIWWVKGHRIASFVSRYEATNGAGKTLFPCKRAKPGRGPSLKLICARQFQRACCRVKASMNEAKA